MVRTIVKDSIEVNSVTLDDEGHAYIHRRINLKEGFSHAIEQVDIFFDSWGDFVGQTSPFEVVISPYPQIPTESRISAYSSFLGAYTAGGDDTVLFKATGLLQDGGRANPTFKQFPSSQIAAQNKSIFYSDHVYVSLHLVGDPDHDITDLRMSFMLVLNDKKVPILTHAIGCLAENHEAMCSQLMSNGVLVSKSVLLGNTFPMWRYGGIRPEHTLSPEAAGSFFLQMPSSDEESMMATAQIRSAVADARSMGAYDSAFGARFPDWCRMGLNEGLASGPVRDQWPPIKHADNGNVLCL